MTTTTPSPKARHGASDAPVGDAGPWRNRIVGTGDEPPDQLVANPANWRTHPGNQRDALRGSLGAVGWVQQVMVNQRTGHVVDGHARVEEALTRGEATVPVLYVDLTPEEEALVLATLDPIGAMATVDGEKLRMLLAEVEFDSEEMRRYLEGLAPDWEAGTGLTDPDDVPEPPKETHIKRGDIFALGDHRLMCGDSTDAGDVARLMGGSLADCVWTDPPYGVNYVGKTKDALTIQNDGPAGLGPMLDKAFALVTTAVRPGSPIYLARPPGALGVEFLNAWLRAGWQLHEELQWVKDTMVLGHSDYHLRHETVVYGWVPGPGRSGRGKHDGTRWYGPNNATSVFEVDRPKASPDHPTGKPVALVEAMLTNSTRPNDAVLEPFSGSGSTIIAAEQLGRRCYAMEIDPRYVAVAIERWEKFTGRKAEPVEDPYEAWVESH